MYNEKLQIKDKKGKNIVFDIQPQSQRTKVRKREHLLCCAHCPRKLPHVGINRIPRPLTSARFSLWKVRKEDQRERREGGAVKVLNTQIPSLYGCHLAGCDLDNDSSSLDGLSTQISPESCNHPSDPERAGALLLPQKYRYS